MEPSEKVAQTGDHDVWSVEIPTASVTASNMAETRRVVRGWTVSRLNLCIARLLSLLRDQSVGIVVHPMRFRRVESILGRRYAERLLE
jgi:hypothetical protein